MGGYIWPWLVRGGSSVLRCSALLSDVCVCVSDGVADGMERSSVAAWINRRQFEQS